MTYKFTSRWNEDGSGITTDIFVVSDTYSGLRDLATATEVPNDVVDWDNTKHDLEASSGEFVEDEMSFSVDETRAQTQTDWDAIEFILAAQDLSVKRFCARIINPASLDPAPEDDFDFRGRIISDMSGEDIDWQDAQYGSAINPLRVWSCTASSFDAGYLIDKEVFTGNELQPGLFEQLSAEWIDDNIKDWIGYFDNTSFGITRVAAWGKLVPLGSLMTELLSLASSDGVNLVWEDSMTPHRVAPARFRFWSTEFGPFGTIKTRYVNYVKPSPRVLWPYEILDDIDPMLADNYQLRAGGDGTQVGDVLVSRRLIFPSEEEKDIAWTRFDSLRELIYEVASDLGMYVTWIYDSASQIRCKFIGRDTLITNDVFLRDASKASIEIRSVAREGEKEKYVGIGTRWTREGGYTVYNYDGYGFRPSGPNDTLPGKGRQTALTISPTVCLLEGRGQDIAPSGEIFGFSLIPHGLVFRGKSAGELVNDPNFDESFTEYNRAVLHTGMYIVCPAWTQGEFNEGVTAGQLIAAPVARLSTMSDGQLISFDAISDFKNWLYGLDDAAYDNEYSITVPGLNAFRFTALGASTWKAAALAARLTLDGIDWVVVGVQRNKYDTELRVHTAERYDRFAAASAVGQVSEVAQIAPDDVSNVQRPVLTKNVVAGEDIDAGQAIAIDVDGYGIVAQPIHTHVGRVIGIAKHSVTDGETVEVQTSGRINVATWDDYGAGGQTFVSDIAPTATVNWSTTAPTLAPVGFQVGLIPIGFIDQDGFLNLNIERGFVLE